MIKLSIRDSQKISIVTLICSLMVIFIHAMNIDQYQLDYDLNLTNKFVYLLQRFISDGICRIAVPIFFVISGFLFFKDVQPNILCFINKFRKRFKSLVIPYLLWNFISYCYFLIAYYIIQLRPFFGRFMRYYYFLDLNDFLQALFLHTYNPVFWFIKDLILLVLFSPIIYLLLKNKIIGIVFVGSISILWITSFPITIFSISLVSVCYFLIGAYIALHPNKIFKYITHIKSNMIRYFLVLIWFMIIIIVIYEPIPVLSNVRIMIGIVAFWNIINVDLLYPWCKNYFKYTFLFYALHLVLLDIIGMLIYYLLGLNPIGAFVNFIASTIISIIVMIILGNRLYYCCPIMYSYLTGGRKSRH